MQNIIKSAFELLENLNKEKAQMHFAVANGRRAV